MSVIIQSNSTSSSDILIPDMGILIPAGGQFETLTTRKEIEALIDSNDVRDLTSDDFGDGNPSLVLNDGTNDIDVDDIERFLLALNDPQPPRKAVRDSTNRDLVYVGRSSSPLATTSESSWQIYRIDVNNPSLKEYADGNASFSNVWDDRETLTYSTV